VRGRRILRRSFVSELGEIREELGAERGRREMAGSTLREGMAEEQRRRGEAERRPNGSATTYVENCTLSETCESRLRRSRRSHRGQSPTPIP
jgi:hypothetical protein